MPGGKHVLGQSRDRHIFGTVKVGEKGQIEIVAPGVVVAVARGGGIVVTRPEVMRDVAAKIFDESDE